jgi:hypothetical protein
VSIEDGLFLIHRQTRHSSFNLLERLYPLKYDKADKEKFVCDGCEFRKHTRSSYVSSGRDLAQQGVRVMDLIHSDI